MTDKTDRQPVVVEQIPALANSISAVASANAPVIFADGVPSFGVNGGVVHATLACTRFHGTLSDHVYVAHLRLPLATAKDLANYLLAALAMLERPNVPEN